MPTSAHNHPPVPEHLQTDPQKAAAHPEWNIWLAASAGTGKTKVLTDRVLRLLLSGVEPARILCLTFTKAAAAEMAERLQGALANWAAATDETLHKALHDVIGHPPDERTCLLARGLFLTVLDDPQGLPIQTIHSFCQRLLQRFPLEAGVSPHFMLWEEAQTRRAQRQLLQQLLQSDQPETQQIMAGLLMFLTSEGRFYEHISRMFMAMQSLGSNWLAEGEVERRLSLWQQELGLPTALTTDHVLRDFCADASIPHRSSLIAIAKAWRQDVKTLQAPAEPMLAWLHAPEDERANPQLLEQYQQALLTQTREPRSFERFNWSRQHPEHLEIIYREQQRLRHFLETRQRLSLLQRTRLLMHAARLLGHAYEQMKHQAGALDFSDMIHKTLHLLYRADMADWVLFRLDGGIDHLLVDEAQDTSPEQWQLIQRLTEEFHQHQLADRRRTLFVVGDRKQSIYGFQGASPRHFVDMQQYYQRKIQAAQQAGHRFEAVSMGFSYRSTPPILKLVDATFREETQQQALGDISRHQWKKEQHGGRIELWPLFPKPEKETHWPPPRTYGNLQQDLAWHIADTIRRWLQDTRLLAASGRAVQPGDIMVLFRSRKSMMYRLNSLLAEMGVPVAGADRFRLLEDIAVQDMLALAHWLVQSGDDFHLACLLKSPLFREGQGVTEEQLYQLCANRANQSLWHYLQQQQDNLSQTLTHTLQQWRDWASTHTPLAFYTRLLLQEGGLQRITARLSVAAEVPLQAFLQLTEQAAMEGVEGWMAWLDWLETSAGDIKREMEGKTQVRVMTVHASKGLQAPIVILPDTVFTEQSEKPPFITRLQADDSPLMVWGHSSEERCQWERDAAEMRKAASQQESQRLLYVALTRAEEELYIMGNASGKGTSREGQWYPQLQQAMLHLGAITEPMPSLWPSSSPNEGGEAATTPVKYVFTEPHLAGDTSSHAIAKQPAPSIPLPVSAPAWLHHPVEAEESLRFRSPSRHEESQLQPPLWTSDTNPETASALIGKARGNLLHELLHYLPDLPPSQHAPRALQYLQQQGISMPDATQILQEVQAVLAMPELTAIREGYALREIPIIGTVNGEAFYGQVDCMWMERKTLYIIDYKTGYVSNPSDIPAHYRQQMQHYAQLLHAVWQPDHVQTGILWTRLPTLVWL